MSIANIFAASLIEDKYIKYIDLADEVDQGGRIDAIVIDFAKAFDVVPHDILIQKVYGTGIGKRVVRWVQEFLNAGLQKVKVGEETSELGYLYHQSLHRYCF